MPRTAETAHFTFAGIGTREATAEEQNLLSDAALMLCRTHGGWCYSGNAPGSDIACMVGAGRWTTAWLPWDRFNYGDYHAEKECGDVVIAGDGPNGRKIASETHPAWGRLRDSVRRLIVRDVYQVIGDKTHPKVSFVLCCATPKGPDDVQGGTGQAVRVANRFNIPVVNVRRRDWRDHLSATIDRLTDGKQEQP